MSSIQFISNCSFHRELLFDITAVPLTIDSIGIPLGYPLQITSFDFRINERKVRTVNLDFSNLSRSSQFVPKCMDLNDKLYCSAIFFHVLNSFSLLFLSIYNNMLLLKFGRVNSL